LCQFLNEVCLLNVKKINITIIIALFALSFTQNLAQGMEFSSEFSEIGVIAEGSDVINAKYVDNELAFLLEIDRGAISVYDIDRPKRCFELDYDSLSYIHDIELDMERNLAYITAANGVNIYNYDDPANLEWLSVYLNYTSSTFIQIRGELLFIGAEDAGLQIVNVTDPNNPIMISQWNDPVGDVGPVYVIEDYDHGEGVDDFAFVGTRIPNVAAPPTILDLKVLNITDPSNVTYVSSVDTGIGYRGGAPKVHVGELVYFNDHNYGLKILNFSDPFNVSVLGLYYDGGFFNDVKVANDEIAFLADDSFGMKIVNCSNPENPVLINSYEHEWQTVRVALIEDIVYLATIGGGVRIITVRSFPKIILYLGISIGGALLIGISILLIIKRKKK